MAIRKIAILGGGIGALTTAVEITNDPQWQQKYEITIYQLGWRLGGKAASGRNLGEYRQIEEHGLHLWMGCYENAFHLIRNVYDECTRLRLTPGSPFPDAKSAFTPLNLTAMAENVDGQWQAWPIKWQFFDGVLPGEPELFTDQKKAPTPWGFFLKVLERLNDYITKSHALNALFAESETLRVNQDSKSVDAAYNLALSMPTDPDEQKPEDRLALIDDLGRFRGLVSRLVATHSLDVEGDLRHAFLIIDIGASMGIGMIRDVVGKGFDNIENLDFSAWLKLQGCQHADSTLPLAIYDACFAYLGGTQRNAGAGSMLYAGLRLMFTYDGAIMWWMNAGMGDIVAAPMYLLLNKRGVKFEFFQKVTNLGLSADGKSIDTIAIDVQATPKNPGYTPIAFIDKVPCWPDRPFYDQLNEGDQMQDPHLVNRDIESWWTDWKPVGQRTLSRAGGDFDIVVLGISLGALPFICTELILKSPQWQAMVTQVATVKTQALQLWLTRSAADLGWNYGPGVLCSYVEPQDTWSDLSHLLRFEHWPAGKNVNQVAYFCNALSEGGTAPFNDPTFPGKERARVLASAKTFIANNLSLMWPNFDPNLLVSQFSRANIDPNERYVLSIAGSKQYRLKSGESGFDNLLLAGDWTLTELAVGCVESAVISGRMASQSICGLPTWIYSESGTGA